MIKYEDECVGPCPQGCMGSSCPYKSVPHLYCDKCNDEQEEVYEVDGEHVCLDCLRDMFPCILACDL